MKRVLAFSLVLFAVAGCAVASVLPDGRVLFMNGLAKIYDPSSGILSNASIPTPGRAWHSMTLLNDGHVLLVGGIIGNANPTSGAVATPAPSGQASQTASETASLYDPATDTYADAGSMAQGRVLHTATLLQDGKVLVVGGAGTAFNLDPTSTGQSSSAPIATAEVYDPGSGTFSPTGSLATARTFHTATLLQDGKVLIVGGSDAANKSLGSAELYDPQTGTFTATGSMTDIRSFHTATLLQDGKVLIVGGLSSSSGSGSSGVDPATQSAELYDPSSGTFTKLTAPLVAPRALHTATLLQDGKVLIAGGLDTGGSGSLLASAELYDPATQTFVKTGDMKHGHAFHAAAILPDGKVVIAGFAGSLTDMLGGGLSGGTATPPPNSNDPLGGAELYDPATGTFSDVQVEPGVMPSFGTPQQTEAPATEAAPTE
jgi:Galactose oxidase, central domain